MRTRVGAARSRPGDRGAILVTTALLIVALVIIVAIVIDLGATRSDRRGGQLAVDTAAASAAQAYKDVQDTVLACQQALDYLKVTLEAPAFVGEGGQTCTSQFSGACAHTVARSLTATAGDYRVTLYNPVIDTSPLMLNTSTIGNAGIAAGTVTTDGQGCERFGVELTTSGEPFFGGVVGSSERTSTVHAVSMVRSGPELEEVAALLLLERLGCSALQTSGGGSTGSGIVVQHAGSTPGIIAGDSAGQSPPCTTNNNADGWVIYGTALPAAGGAGPSITAEDVPATATTPAIKGIIAIYAKAVGGRAGYTAPTGLNVEPIEGKINSRSISDRRYNGANTQISQLHTLVEQRTATPPATVDVTISGNTECKGNIDAAKLSGTVIFVDCSTFEPGLNIFPNATEFLVRGNVDLKSNKILSLPKVQNFFVRGCSVGGCSGGNTFAVSVANNAALLVNTGETALPSDPLTNGVICGNRRSPKHVNDNLTVGTTTNTTRLGSRGGSFNVSGLVRMCQTTVYVGENDAAYAIQTQPNVLTAPENYPTITSCTSSKPCPKNTAATLAGVTFSGGGAVADWSAPNQLDTKPLPAETAFGVHPFEDLALWTETSTASNVRGQGTNSTTGVYFLPNASFTFTGQGTQAQPLDAQFFVRRLDVSGQGSLYMKPDPANSLEIEVFGNVSLIR